MRKGFQNMNSEPNRETMNVQDKSALQPEPRPRRVRNCIWIALAAMALVVSVGTSWYSSGKLEAAHQRMGLVGCGSAALEGIRRIGTGTKADETWLAAAREREIARIRAERKAAQESFRAAIEKEHEAFRRRVAERAEGFDVVRAGIPSVVGKYGFKKCWSVMAALAKDKVARKFGKGRTTNFDELMNGDLREQFYRPLENARESVVALLPEYANRLEACREEFATQLKKIPGWDKSLGEIPKSLQAESLRIEEIMQGLMAAQIGSSVSAAFDAACLAAVYRTVASLLAKAATRLAAGTVAGTATAMVDSPAPGPADLVGLGIFGVGAVATAWEVRKAAKVIPTEFARVMRETVDQQSSEVQSRVLDEGEKLYLYYSQAVR